MKKFTAALCTVLLLIGTVLVPGAAAAGPALANTRAYCIMDADTGLVIFTDIFKLHKMLHGVFPFCQNAKYFNLNIA